MHPYRTRYQSTPRPLPWSILLVLALLESILLGTVLALLPAAEPKAVQDPIKVRLSQKSAETKQPKSAADQDDHQKQIIETPQQETLPPEKADFLGSVDHQTAKQTKLKNPNQSAEDAASGNGQVEALRKHLERSSKLHNEAKSTDKLKIKEPKEGPKRAINESELQKFLPDLRELAQAFPPAGSGHQDYIKSDQIEDGEVIDVNTTEFRWLGYFTNVRKNVMQAFFSPYSRFGNSKEIQERLDAYGSAKLQGQAKVMLTITRTGLLVDSALIQSSGDTLVDEFWEKVLNLAAPFPPLPRDYPKETLKFTYTLEYDYVYKRKAALEPLDVRGRQF